MESTVVCVDNSEFTRNGDYAPTRFQAQADAVNLLAGAKTQHHPENTVGVMSMAGRSPRVLVTPTTELGKVLNAMMKMDIEGDVHLATAVQIAQLALKHRENKNQRQRIVIFIGSPIQEDKDSMVKIARKLKKNNIAVDIVSFGSEEANVEKLEAFQAAVNSNGNSHLVTVPPGTILSDQLFATPIFMEEGASSDGGGPAPPRSNVVDGFDYGELGVDPTLDPELALALRADDVEAMDEDVLLQEALALSMQAEQPTPAAATAAAVTPAAPVKEEAPRPAPPAREEEEGMEEDDPELALALQMSLAEEHTREEGEPEQG
ncbi:26S proteasome non-ATPase regulatory subunit 4-like protein [Auxenochlorella protothecoides]|uniref:26S proteasome non-ATPase regulatory subunit 4 homolog n=1 Tax=Auxenochlorella protothecoides TaxID=3075 RepID=A0A087SEL8_AUXPR|nr:26S proteasome non-ATPase regulatory subunit 4-like protein [Auxenochlorella protothecoides]KFM24172.1 26S proteasome non-ATPase regulatory subunit 4-like protein [Auxenochlorella protothecoides]